MSNILHHSTLLHLAVKNNDVDEVINLLRKKSDIDLKRIINASDVNGLSPLHVASMNGFSIIAKILLDKGAIVNAKDQHGRAPIHVAIKRGDYSELTLKCHRDNNCVRNTGSTPLRASRSFGNEVGTKEYLDEGANVSSKHKPRDDSLHVGIKRHDEVVEVLLKYGADVNSTDRFGSTPLHSSAHYGNENICKFLLEKGADVNARREDGETPLYTAVERGHQKLVEILLEHGADVDLANQFRKTPLYISSHRVISKMLLDKGANADAREHYGRTPLHGVVERNTETALDCLQVLLEYRANVNAANMYGNTSLHSSAYYGNEEIMKYLLRNGADIQSKNQNGDSPLHVAVKCKHEKLVKILLEHRAIVNWVNKFNKTPLHVSSKRVISKMLLEKGADVDAKENDGKTPFYRAVERNDKNSLEVLEVLLEYRANINSVDKYGNTPLHCSASGGNENIRTFLLENGADDDAKNQNGETPLHVAVKSGQEEAVKVLSAYRGDIDALDNSGWTPLHIAVSHRKTTIVKILLDNGAEVDAKDTYGTTPLHLAVECAYDEIVEILFEYSAHIDDRVFQRTLPTEHERTMIIAKIVKKHIIKLKALNVNVCKLYFDSLDFDDEMRDFLEECEREVKQMRRAINDETNVSFYDILAKSVKRVAIYTSNASIVKACMIGVFNGRFPIYSNMIRCKFMRGLKRACLLEIMSKAFASLVSYQLTNNVTNEILGYVSDKDLLNIEKAYRNE